MSHELSFLFNCTVAAVAAAYKKRQQLRQQQLIGAYVSSSMLRAHAAAAEADAVALVQLLPQAAFCSQLVQLLLLQRLTLSKRRLLARQQRRQPLPSLFAPLSHTRANADLSTTPTKHQPTVWLASDQAVGPIGAAAAAVRGYAHAHMRRHATGAHNQ